MYHTIVSVIQYSKFVPKKPHSGTKFLHFRCLTMKLKCMFIYIYVSR